MAMKKSKILDRLFVFEELVNCKLLEVGGVSIEVDLVWFEVFAVDHLHLPIGPHRLSV